MQVPPLYKGGIPSQPHAQPGDVTVPVLRLAQAAEGETPSLTSDVLSLNIGRVKP